LSLSLLLDEDSQAKYLVNLLKAAGHDVVTVNDVGITGFPDDKVLDYARQYNYILITRNCDDFQELHQANPIHPGILAIYRDAEPTKNMSYQVTVKAIGNLELAGVDLANQFVVLNQWNY
jgi:predicted nuclease of predicted toxin-antitoxin system